MQKVTRLKTFTDRYPLIGPAVWMLSIQYFVIQIIAAHSYRYGYSLRFNTISDLGNSLCGAYSHRLVCSPQHNVMNASFILLGLTMATGSLLIYQEFKKSAGSLIGFSFMALAGLGTCLVGLYPENTNAAIHTLGASQPFLLGNIALVLLSYSLPLPKVLRYYTRISGYFTLFALLFFITGHYLGLGIGGLERLVAYPQTVWLIVFGMYISKTHIVQQTKH
jgi:hypothetical membrane protein